jgi:hypothetical protein
MAAAEQYSPAVSAAILKGPALPPPPGVRPDFDNPPNGSAVAIFTLAFTLAIVTIAVVMRIYTKLRLLGSFSKDDSMSRCDRSHLEVTSQMLTRSSSHFSSICAYFERVNRLQTLNVLTDSACPSLALFRRILRTIL